MKRLLFLSTLLLVALPTSAQTRTRTVETIKNSKKVTIVREYHQKIDKHDIRIGVGSWGFVSNAFIENSRHIGNYLPSDFDSNIVKADTYLSPRYFIANYTASYTYHHLHWLQYGATVSFGASVQSRYNSITDAKIENLNSYAIGIMPTARFVWLLRNKVQMYSSISLGVGIRINNKYTPRYFNVLPTYDIAAIGCAFGGKFFGFVELGSGMTGIARAGLGYRFNGVKK